MRYTPIMRGRALWLIAFIAIVLFGGTSMYRDARPERLTRPGFTLFAVDRGGAQTTLALFDGNAWRPPCDPSSRQPLAELPGVPAGEGPATIAPTQLDIAGLAGSPGAPLLQVRELTGDTVGWEPTVDIVEARALEATGFSGPRSSVPRVYSADAAGTGVAYVELTLRAPEPAFRGFVASGWVIAREPEPAGLVGFEVAPFGDYAEFLKIDRQVPLGLVGEGDDHVWVMKRLPTARGDVRFLGVTARGVEERLRVARSGC